MLKLGKDVNWPLFKNLAADDGMVNMSLRFYYPSILQVAITNLLMVVEYYYHVI